MKLLKKKAMMKSIVLVVFFISVSSMTNAQEKGYALRVGDKVPDVLLKNIINYKWREAKISDFKGKLIILDFWSKYCSVCISAFPEMHKLQDQFKDKLQVLLVTKNSLSELSYLFKNSPNVKNATLPIVIGDTVLHRLFPHGAEPFHVWIDTNGIVKATTNFESTTSQNIKDYFAGKDPQIYQREDQMDFNSNSPLLIEGNGRQWSHLKYYSMLMNKINLQRNGVSALKNPISGETIGLSMINVSILMLYSMAYEFQGKIIVETPDAEEYFEPIEVGKMDAWRKKGWYCYELVVPSNIEKKRQRFMQEDLSRYFGLNGRVERRKVSCLVLYRINNKNLLTSKGGEELSEHTDKGWVFRNVSMTTVLANLTNLYRWKDPILIDETGYKGNVDMNLASDLKNLSQLQQELSHWGLNIRMEEREIDCLVLTATKD